MNSKQSFPIKQNKITNPENGISKPTDATLTISQVLGYFEHTLKKPNNYLRIVRRYLEFCVEQQYFIDPISMALYTSGQRPSLVSPVRRFIKFAAGHHINKVKADTNDKKRPPANSPYILAFLHDSKTLRGEQSKESYLKALNTFFYYLDDNELSFNGNVVNEFIMELKKEAKSAFTINLYLSAIKQFTKWLLSNRVRLGLDLNLHQIEALRDVENVRGLKIERKFYKDSLSENQRKQLLDNIQDPRDRAIIALLSITGLRTIEITRLQIIDVNLENGLLYVLGKGKATKAVVKLFELTKKSLSQYIESVKPIDKAQKGIYLFGKLKTSQVQYIARKYLIKNNLKKKGVSPHSLRHTAGQVLLANGAQPMYVQRQLRHQQFETTQFYIQKQIEKDFLEGMPDK